jgi:hypothetical protein
MVRPILNTSSTFKYIITTLQEAGFWPVTYCPAEQ